MPEARAGVPPGRDPARQFTFESVEITCPWCFGTIGIECGNVFMHGSGAGKPLDHEGDPTLGDLINAARAHVCDGDEADADV